MLKVIPKIWSYSFSVMDGANSVAQVDLSWWRDRGELRVGDATYTARRVKSSYVLESADAVIVRAERPRKLFRQFLIKHAGRQYILRAKSAFRREFRLFDGGTQVGFISPEGLFTRNAAVKLPKQLPLFLQVFI